MALENRAPECGECFREGSHVEVHTLIVEFSGVGRGLAGAGVDLLFPSNLCQDLPDERLGGG
jgi:hypothetical protein